MTSRIQRSAGPADHRAGITVCAEAKPAWFDPHSQIAGASRVFSDNVVPGLLAFGDDDAPAPSLATSWHWADDRTLILDLNPAATFSSGRPVSATAARENLESILSGESLPFNRDEFMCIDSIEDDGPQLRLRLGRTFSPLTGVLANGLGIVDSMTSRPGAPVGAGRWRMARATDSGYRFASRHHQDLTLDWLFCGSSSGRRQRIVSSRVDAMLGDIGAAAARGAGWQCDTSPGNGPMHLTFNMQRWPTSDPGFRRRIAAGIDRERVIDRGFAGAGDTSASPFSSSSRYAMDEDAFEPVAGTRSAARSEDYPTLRLVVGGTPFMRATQEVAAQVQSLTGAKVEVTSIPNPRWWPGTYLSGDWDMAFQVWTPMADPHFIYKRRYATGASHNAPHYSSPEFDDAVQRATQVTDLAARMEWYHVAEAARRRDLPTIYLGFPHRTLWSPRETPVPAPRRNWFVDFDGFTPSA